MDGSSDQVYVAWQYKDDPESARREYQFLGVFSTEDLAQLRIAPMRTSGWNVQVAEATLDPDEVC